MTREGIQRDIEGTLEDDSDDSGDDDSFYPDVEVIDDSDSTSNSSTNDSNTSNSNSGNKDIFSKSSNSESVKVEKLNDKGEVVDEKSFESESDFQNSKFGDRRPDQELDTIDASASEEVQEKQKELQETQSDIRSVDFANRQLENRQDILENRGNSAAAQKIEEKQKVNKSIKKDLETQKTLENAAIADVKNNLSNQPFEKDILQSSTRQNIFRDENTAPATKIQDKNIIPSNPIERAQTNIKSTYGNIKNSKTSAFVNPTNSVDNQRSFSNELADVGSEIIRESEKGGKRATDRLPVLNALGNPIGQTVAASELTAQGKPAEGLKEFLVPGTQTELGEKRVKESSSSFISGVGTLAGFTAGVAGASGVVLSNEIQKARGKNPSGATVGEAVVTGLGLQAGAISRNPGSFAATELSEEFGEAAGTAGLSLAAPTLTIDPTISGNTRTGKAIQKAKAGKDTAKGLVSGDLGTRVREDQLVSRNVENLEEQALNQRLRNLESTGNQRSSMEVAEELNSKTPGELEDLTLLDETVKTSEDGAILREVQGVKQGSVVQGQRIETPVSRKEFLNDRISKENLGRAAALGVQAAGVASGAPTVTSNVGASLDPSTELKPDTDLTPDTGRPSSSPERVKPDNVFSETVKPGQNTDLTPELDQVPTLEGLNDEDIGVQAGLDQKTPQRSPNEEVNQPLIGQPEQDFIDTPDITQDITTTPDTTPEQKLITPDLSLTPTPDLTPDTKTPGNNFTPGLIGASQSQGLSSGFEDNLDRSSSTDFASSVAGLTGFGGGRGVSEGEFDEGEDVLTGLEIRL